MMGEAFLWTGLVITLAAALCLYRVLKGPTVPDRIVAVNVIGTYALVVLVLIAYVSGQVMFIDIALTYALLNFLIAIIAARYLGTGRVFG
ncbi:monovalent cation/H+ antiporter complex subunit F [Halobacteriota archaeon]